MARLLNDDTIPFINEQGLNQPSYSNCLKYNIYIQKPAAYDS